MGGRLVDALIETAHDAADIRDPEVLFTAIARRTRDVLGTDMAYVSTNDLADSSTAILATAGVQTEAYARIAMPLGTGVLGTAAGGTAVHTEDYLSDTRRTHLAHIDDAVAGEGVRAIAGVPLTSAGTVLGALMVAHRSAHVFTESQLSDLTAIARVTALALELSAARQQLAGASAALVGVRQEADRLQRRAAFHDALPAPATVQEVVDLARTALGLDVVVLDPVQGAAAADGGHALSATALEELLSAAPGPLVSRPSGDVAVVLDEDGAVLAQRITGLDGEAAVVAVHPSAPAPVVAEVARALTAARVYEQALASATSRTHRELVEDLLGQTSPDASLLRRARAAHLLPSDCHVVVVAQVAPHHLRAAASRMSSRVAGTGVAAVVDDAVCVLVRTPADADAVKCATDVIAAVQEVVERVGCAGPVRGFAALRDAHAEARAVTAALTALGRRHVVADAGLLGVTGLLLSGTAPSAARRLVGRQLAPLLALEPGRRGELTRTAQLFLELTSVSGVAEALGVHVNTVRQRLQRIDGLLGAEWRGSRKLDVHTALVAHRLRAAELPSSR